MINSTHNVHIDGTVINHDDLRQTLDFSSGDTMTRWVLRPLALLAALGMAVAVFFASAFLLVLSFALVPVLAVAVWAVKSKLEREQVAADPVVDTQ